MSKRMAFRFERSLLVYQSVESWLIAVGEKFDPQFAARCRELSRGFKTVLAMPRDRHREIIREVCKERDVPYPFQQ